MMKNWLPSESKNFAPMTDIVGREMTGRTKLRKKPAVASILTYAMTIEE